VVVAAVVVVAAAQQVLALALALALVGASCCPARHVAAWHVAAWHVADLRSRQGSAAPGQRCTRPNFLPRPSRKISISSIVRGVTENKDCVHSRQVYFCVRPATVRGAASIQSAAFPDMIRPGATVVVSEEREVDGHRRALLESKAQAGRVSMSTNTKELFEPLDGTSLLVRSAVRAVMRK
jgi:hypothetical protein